MSDAMVTVAMWSVMALYAFSLWLANKWINNRHAERMAGKRYERSALLDDITAALDKGGASAHNFVRVLQGRLR